MKLLIPRKITVAPDNDVQAVLLQSERVLEMHFPANRRPKFRDLELRKQ